jgi:hypothetical protein
LTPGRAPPSFGAVDAFAARAAALLPTTCAPAGGRIELAPGAEDGEARRGAAPMGARLPDTTAVCATAGASIL